MARPGAIGAANDVREYERVAAVERGLPSRCGRMGLPKFWQDADVRRFLIAEHNFLTIDTARAQLVERVGIERTPSRSAIGRFWQLLDAFWSKAR